MVDLIHPGPGSVSASDFGAVGASGTECIPSGPPFDGHLGCGIRLVPRDRMFLCRR